MNPNKIEGNIVDEMNQKNQKPSKIGGIFKGAKNLTLATLTALGFNSLANANDKICSVEEPVKSIVSKVLEEKMCSDQTCVTGETQVKVSILKEGMKNAKVTIAKPKGSTLVASAGNQLPESVFNNSSESVDGEDLMNNSLYTNYMMNLYNIDSELTTLENINLDKVSYNGVGNKISKELQNSVFADVIDKNQNIFDGMTPEQIHNYLLNEGYNTNIKFIRIEKAPNPLVGVIDSKFLNVKLDKSSINFPKEVTKDNFYDFMMEVLQNRGAKPDLETRYKERITNDILPNEKLLTKVLKASNKGLSDFNNIKEKEVNPYVIERIYTGIISILINDKEYASKNDRDQMALAQDLYTYIIASNYYDDGDKELDIEALGAIKGYINEKEGYTFIKFDEVVINYLASKGIKLSFEGIMSLNSDYEKYKEVYGEMQKTIDSGINKGKKLLAKSEKLEGKRAKGLAKRANGIIRVANENAEKFDNLNIESKTEVLEMFSEAKKSKGRTLKNIINLVTEMDKLEQDGVEYDERLLTISYNGLKNTDVKGSLYKFIEIKKAEQQERIRQKDALIAQGQERIKQKDAIIRKNNQIVDKNNQIVDKNNQIVDKNNQIIKMFDSLISMK